LTPSIYFVITQTIKCNTYSFPFPLSLLSIGFLKISSANHLIETNDDDDHQEFVFIETKIRICSNDDCCTCIYVEDNHWLRYRFRFCQRLICLYVCVYIYIYVELEHM